MGCSISKELERPIQTSKEAWDAMLSQGLAVQKNSGFKSSDRGYIAAIFSANYGTLRMDASLKSVDSKILAKSSGNYHQHKVRKEGGGDHQLGDGNHRLPGKEKMRKSRTDSRVDVPKESEAAAAKRATEDCGEPETINMWELMQGLDEEDGSPSVGGAESENSTVFCEDRAAMAGETVRSRFTTIRSVEEVDAAIAARSNNKTSPADWKKNSSKPKEIRQLDDQTNSKSSSIPSLSRRDDSIEKSSWIPENLQRALSFKYIFNSSNQDDASQSAMDSNSDAVSLATRSMEGDGPSSPSSPEFSTAASLKDWLPESCASKQMDDSQASSSSLTSIIEAPPQQIELVAPYLPNSKRLRSTISKYGCGSDDQIVSEPNNSSTKSAKELEKPEMPVFDADLLESFERAMEQLSQEEWHAVRNMEVGSTSPKEFLHLMNSLRSDSNQLEGKKAQTNVATKAVKGNKIVEAADSTLNSTPSDNSKDSKQLLTQEKKLPIRQNSGEVKENRGMEESVVVLYSTSWQGNAKVFEDCNAVRMILRSVGASFDERNIHEHPEYEQQLKQSNNKTTIVPTLWVKGRCMAGADSILQLYKKGILGSLLRDAVPGGGDVARCKAPPCICRGGKFLICPLCKGRGRLVRLGEGASSCRHCSGTGLIKCPNCSSSS